MTTYSEQLLGVVDSVGVKSPVTVATTANITLSGEQTIDGIAVVTGDRVLVKDQTTGSENGVYSVGVSDWTRALDFNDSRDVVSGSSLYVRSGTVSGGSVFYLTTVDPITIGTTSLSFGTGNSGVGQTSIGYDSRAAVALATVPALVMWLTTAGYASLGDHGGATYVRVGSEPAHAYKVQSADGAWWEGLPRDGVVSCRSFGAVCDVTGDFNATSTSAFNAENTAIATFTDDTAAIQGAIDYAMDKDQDGASAQPVIVRLPGMSRITDTIHLGYGNRAGSVTFEAMGEAYRGEDTMGGRSGLVCTFSDRPMINFQQARRSKLRNMFLRYGLDYTGVVATNTGLTPTVEANWDAVKAASQYAPGAAVTVDAYSGTEPGSPYPDATYPSHESQTQYGKGASSGIEIENLFIRNAQVAICVKPSDDSSNSDFVAIKRIVVEFSKYVLSIGASQSRNVYVEDVNAGRVWTILTNNKHGQQTGQFGGPIKNLSIGSFVGQIFEFNSSATVGSTLSFENIFGEGLHRIGDIVGATSGDTPLHFYKCRFNFRHETNGNGVPANVADFGGMTAGVTFASCAFTGFPHGVPIKGANYVIFDDCEMADAEPTSDERLFHNATAGGLVCSEDPRYPAELRGVSFSQRALSTGAEGRIKASENMVTTGRDYCVPIYLQRVCHSATGTARYRIQQDRPVYRHQAAKSVCWSSASRSNLTITHTWTSMSVEELFWEGGYEGDLWIDVNTHTIGRVASVTTNGSDVDMTSVLLSNFNTTDGGSTYDLFETLSLTSGNVSFLNCRIWATRGPLVGSCTSGSATLVCQSGYSGATSTVLGDISTAGTINDMLANANRTPDHFDSSTDCEVSSISLPNITMGGNSAETWGASGVYPLQINYWVRDEV